MTEDVLIDSQDLRILKNILQNPNFAIEFSNNYGDFLFTPAIREFAQTCISYCRSYRTAPTRRVLEDSNIKNTSVILDELEQLPVDKGEFAYDLDKLKTRFISQQAGTLRKSLDGISSPEAIQTEIKKYQESLRLVDSSARKPFIKRSARDFIKDFAESYVSKLNNPESAQGILTKYTHFDYVTNGLVPSDLLLIGGETNSGKSQLLSNLAVQIWMQDNKIEMKNFTKGHNITYFSLEMPYEACFRRIMAKMADIPNYGIRDAKLNISEAEAMNLAMEFIKNYPNEFDIVDIPRGTTVEMIEEIIRDSRGSYKPEVVIVDYLGLMDDSSVEGDDWLKLGQITGKLHELARVYGIAIITAAQLNRINPASKKKEEVVGNHRFGRSSLMMHHATLGLQIESRPDEDKLGTMSLHLTKNREGEKISFHLVKKLANSAIIDSIDDVIITNKQLGINNMDLSTKKDISSLLSKHSIKI